MPEHAGTEIHGEIAIVTVNKLSDYGRTARELVAHGGKEVRTTSRVKNGLGFILPTAAADAAGYIDKPKPKRSTKAKTPTPEESSD